MITTLTDYFREYGDILLQTATERTRPLHTPGKDPEVMLNLLRKPKKGQHARVTAAVKSLNESQCVQLACATGTGKTYLSIATCEGHAKGKPYRAMVVCPPHLVKKWKREIEETVPGVYVAIVEHYSQLTALRRTLPCNRTMWLVVSSTMAKLGCETKPAISVYDTSIVGGRRRTTKIRVKDIVYCPACNAEQVKIDAKTGNRDYLEADVFRKQELPCCECGEQLWQWTRGKSGLDRWPIAKYINKRLRHFFHYGIFDECFRGGTLVATTKGYKAIADIRPGDMVLSERGGERVYRTVLRVIARKRTQPIVKVRHSLGVLECTSGHYIYLSNGATKRACELVSGDVLITNDTTRTTPTEAPLRDVRNDIQPSCRETQNVTSDVRKGMPTSICGTKAYEEREVDSEDVTATVLSMVRNRVCDDIPKATNRSMLLWEAMFNQGDCTIAELSCQPVETTNGSVSEDGLGENEKAECKPRVQGEASHVKHAKEREVVLRYEGRKRIANETAVMLSEGFGVREVRRSGDSYGQSELEIVRSGYSDSIAANSHRVRWSDASHAAAKEPGSNQDQHARREGLDCDSVLECGDRREAGRGRGCNHGFVSSEVLGVEFEHDQGNDELVFDLEVEDTHRYFADGVLVSNCHKAKADDTEIGNAFADVSGACRHTIALTGTLLGGYAWHARTLLFRMRPCTLVEEGMDWDDVSAFNERYGRFESTIVTRNKLSNRMYGKTGKSKTVRNLRPGIMPQLFGRHLMPFCVFLNLEDISQDLPPTSETVVECDMDAELSAEYHRVESAIKDVIMEALLAGDKSILSNMLHTLLGYPDLSTGWDTIHMKYKEADEILTREVVTPKSLNQNVIRNKEQELIDAVLAQRDRGRKVWIYTTMVEKRDVISRLERLLRARGLRVKSLRSKVKALEREAWIADNGPDLDVCLSHPALVETGLDFFDSKRTYNFPTLMFYQTGYEPFVLRQAGGRAYRIGQWEPCETFYFFYKGTMQSKAMSLMAKKIAASKSIEGKFDTDGLVSLAGDYGTMEMELAKSLVDQLQLTQQGV